MFKFRLFHSVLRKCACESTDFRVMLFICFTRCQAVLDIRLYLGGQIKKNILMRTDSYNTSNVTISLVCLNLIGLDEHFSNCCYDWKVTTTVI